MRSDAGGKKSRKKSCKKYEFRVYTAIPANIEYRMYGFRILAHALIFTVLTAANTAVQTQWNHDKDEPKRTMLTRLETGWL